MRILSLRDVSLAATFAFLGVIAPPLASPSQATPRLALPPGLQQAALLCIGEALQLCPNALKAKDHGIACIREKRHLLSVPCRDVYDQGVSFLKGDVHLNLRALQRKPPRAPGG